jgi:hypothetical protein
VKSYFVLCFLSSRSESDSVSEPEALGEESSSAAMLLRLLASHSTAAVMVWAAVVRYLVC